MVRAADLALRKLGLGEVGGFSGLSRDVSAGFAAGLSALTSCFAYGVLIFSGPLRPFLAEGIAASLITCVACALVTALTSRFKIAIAAPAASTSALIAVLMASLAPVMKELPPDQRLTLAYAALFAATAAPAAAMLLVGFIRAGKFVRFFPYPVIAGFMGATGWLVVEGAVMMVTDLPIALHALPQFAKPHEALLLAMLLAWTAALWAITNTVKHPLTVPAAIVFASLATNLALLVFGISTKDAQTQGILFSVTSAGWPGIPILQDGFFLGAWSPLLPVAGTIGAIVLISVLQCLLLATGLEVTTRTEVDLDQEARRMGWGGNLASALLGGFVGQISLGATAVNRSAEGATRITGVVVSLLALATMLGASAALQFVPKFVLGGALLIQGIRLMQEWGVATRLTLPRAEWLLVIAIILITAWFGFISAEVTGLLAACVLFALSVSRIDVVRAIYGLDARNSSVVWPDDETRYLAAHGASVQVIELRGFVFFGSAHRLRERVKSIVAERAPVMLIFDFSRVIGIDSSAATAMVRISRLLRESGIQQSVVGFSPGVTRSVSESGGLDENVVILADIDEALERGEIAVLAARAADSAAIPTFHDWIAAILGGPDYVEVLQQQLVATHHEPGRFFCRPGDMTDELYFVEKGQVSAVIEQNVSAPIRVRVFGPRTIVGEIAFVLDVPRTASLRVDEHAIVWSLSRRAFSGLMTMHPNLALALMQAVVRMQAERLSFATRRIAGLS